MGIMKIICALFWNLMALVIGFGIILLAMFKTDPRKAACDATYRAPLFSAGLLIIVMSIMGLCRVCCRVKIMRWIYVLLILGCIFEMGFMVAVGRMVMSQGSKGVEDETIQKHVSDFSPWLQRRIRFRWPAISACLSHTNICPPLTSNESKLRAKALSHALQRGCCVPPPGCIKQKLRNATRAEKTAAAAPEPATIIVVSSPSPSFSSSSQHADHDSEIFKINDCERWSDRPHHLCFNCDTCKAGFMTEVVKSWKMNFLLETGLLTCLTLIFFISLRATFSRNGECDYDEEESCRGHVSRVVRKRPGIIVEID